MLQGAFTHTDSSGRTGTIGPGDLQWMTAGRGIVHSEMPATDGDNVGLQLWVNLAARNKMTMPQYQGMVYMHTVFYTHRIVVFGLPFLFVRETEKQRYQSNNTDRQNSFSMIVSVHQTNSNDILTLQMYVHIRLDLNPFRIPLPSTLSSSSLLELIHSRTCCCFTRSL